MYKNATGHRYYCYGTDYDVLPVAMFTGFTDDFLADEVHYNQAGAEFIADRYFTALVNVLDNPSE